MEYVGISKTHSDCRDRLNGVNFLLNFFFFSLIAKVPVPVDYSLASVHGVSCNVCSE